MKYNGRIIVVVVALVFTLVIRGYGILYYNYPTYQFPFISLGGITCFLVARKTI